MNEDLHYYKLLGLIRGINKKLDKIENVFCMFNYCLDSSDLKLKKVEKTFFKSSVGSVKKHKDTFVSGLGHLKSADEILKEKGVV